MSAFGETPSDWLDRELRRVPLPDGMLHRLRALAALSDEKLDAVLRDVPLPASFLSRLEEVAVEATSVYASVVAESLGSVQSATFDPPAIDDATLDLALRDVPLPAGLIARLSAIAIDRAKPLEDVRLRDVPLPDGFTERLAQSVLWTCLTDPENMLAEERKAAELPATTRRWKAGRPAAAVAVLAACFLLALAVVLRSNSNTSGPIPVVTGQGTQTTDGATKVVIDPAQAVDNHELDGHELDGPELPDGVKPSELNRTVVAGGPQRPEDFDLPPEWPALPDDEDWALASISGPDPQPRRVFVPLAKGLVPAWKEKQVDLLLSLLANKVHPVVPLLPTMHVPNDAPLLTCRVPTTTNTDSYETAWSLLSKQRLSGAQRIAAQRRLQEEVRPEEFLAALDYHFTPPSPGTLGLRTAGGVSPFGPAQQRLLQVAVVAGDSPSPSRLPMHMTLVVDASTGSADSGMLDRARRAMRGFCQRLGPSDRLSLVTLRNGEAELTVREAGLEQLAQVKEAIDAIAPGRETHLPEGLWVAAAAALVDKTARSFDRRIVVLSDSQADLTHAARQKVSALIGRCATSGVSVWIADLNPAAAESNWLAQIVAAQKGRCDRVKSVTQISRFLGEALTGRSSNIAEDVRISVTFNPRTIAAYRLIGHEATSVLDVTPATIDATLCAGEVCTGLFEVELRGEGDDLAATVEVTWREPGQSESKREIRRVSRWQLADSLLETPPSVQAAAAAAETAEMLRHSPFAAGRDHTWARVRQVAIDSHPALADEPTFRRLMQLIDRAERWGSR